jgi:hypothetical protein
MPQAKTATSKNSTMARSEMGGNARMKRWGKEGLSRLVIAFPLCDWVELERGGDSVPCLCRSASLHLTGEIESHGVNGAILSDKTDRMPLNLFAPRRTAPS